jgi:hypothetical protein
MKRAAFFIALTVLSSSWCLGQWEPERTHWFFDIVIPAGHKVEAATCIFCSIRVDGELQYDASTQWGDIEVNGIVGRDVTAVAGDIRLGRGAQIKGDSVSVFGDTLLSTNSQIAGDAIVSLGRLERSPGTITTKEPVVVALPVLSSLRSRLRTTMLFWLLGVVVSLPLAFLSLLMLKRRRLEMLVQTMKLRRWRTVLYGGVIFGLLTAALAIGGETEYADELELPLTILLVLLAAPGYSAISLWLGGHWGSSRVLALLGGTIALVSAQVVPLLGWILALALTVISLGAPLASLHLRSHTSSAEALSRV